MIKEMAFVCYPVKNAKLARVFYEGILELKPTSVFDQEGMLFIEYDLGSSTFAIGSEMEGFKQSCDGASVAFEVEDFDKMITKLRNKKVKFASEPQETRVCFMATILDPDGSRVIIHKRKNL